MIHEQTVSPAQSAAGVVRSRLDPCRVGTEADLTTIAGVDELVNGVPAARQVLSAVQRAWAVELEIPAPSSGGTAMAGIVVPVAAAGWSGGADWSAEDRMPPSGMPTAAGTEG